MTASDYSKNYFYLDKKNYKYKKKNWKNLNISKRILAWILNADIILNNADSYFKQKFFNSIITQVNHLEK